METPSNEELRRRQIEEYRHEAINYFIERPDAREVRFPVHRPFQLGSSFNPEQPIDMEMELVSFTRDELRDAIRMEEARRDFRNAVYNNRMYISAVSDIDYVNVWGDHGTVTEASETTTARTLTSEEITELYNGGVTYPEMVFDEAANIRPNIYERMVDAIRGNLAGSTIDRATQNTPPPQVDNSGDIRRLNHRMLSEARRRHANQPAV